MRWLSVIFTCVGCLFLGSPSGWGDEIDKFIGLDPEKRSDLEHKMFDGFDKSFGYSTINSSKEFKKSYSPLADKKYGGKTMSNLGSKRFSSGDAYSWVSDYDTKSSVVGRREADLGGRSIKLKKADLGGNVDALGLSTDENTSFNKSYRIQPGEETELDWIKKAVKEDRHFNNKELSRSEVKDLLSKGKQAVEEKLIQYHDSPAAQDRKVRGFGGLQQEGAPTTFSRMGADHLRVEGALPVNGPRVERAIPVEGQPGPTPSYGNETVTRTP